MTVEVHLLKSSGNITLGARFEPHSTQWNFIVTECPAVVEGVEQAPTLNNTAELLEAFSDTNGLDGWRFKAGYALEYYDSSTSTWNLMSRVTSYGRWLVRGIQASPHPTQKYAWNVTVTETNMGKVASDDSGETTVYRGDTDVSVNVVSTGKNKKAWRTKGTLPTEARGPVIYASGGQNYILEWCPAPWSFCNSGDDIGGDSIDINNGQPIDLQIRQEQITIEYVVRAPIYTWDDTKVSPYLNSAGAYPYARLEDLRAFIGRRNWDNFALYDAGFLRITDVAVQPLHHEFKRVVITMLYDEWMHADQRPFVTKSGILSAENSCEGETVPDGETEFVNLVANYVGWIQPFLEGFSFGTTPQEFFNTDDWETIWDLLNSSSSTYAINAAGTCP